MTVLIVGMPEEKWTSATPKAGKKCRIMLAATITAALIYFMVQSSGALALGTACWDERLSRAGRNSSCVGKFSCSKYNKLLDSLMYIRFLSLDLLCLAQKVVNMVTMTSMTMVTQWRTVSYGYSWYLWWICKVLWYYHRTGWPENTKYFLKEQITIYYYVYT